MKYKTYFWPQQQVIIKKKKKVQTHLKPTVLLEFTDRNRVVVGFFSFLSKAELSTSWIYCG